MQATGPGPVVASIAQLEADLAAERIDARTYITRLQTATAQLGSGAAVFLKVQAPPAG